MSFINEEAKRPRLLVFAGPNGSGKSTVTKALPLVGVYVNADEIKRVSGCADLEAAQEAEIIRETLLRDRSDFTFETVLSTERNLALLERAKESDYEVCAVFVLTNDPSINVRRVKARFAAGGHDVSEEKIYSRYEKSLNNLSRLVRIADVTRIVDNSGEEPCLVCDVKNGSARLWENENWSKAELLRLLEKR